MGFLVDGDFLCCLYEITRVDYLPYFMQEVPPLDVPELLAYLVKQSGPLFDQLGVGRGKKKWYLLINLMIYPFYFFILKLSSWSICFMDSG